MFCIAHVGTRNVSVDRLTPSELGDTTTFIQEKKVAAGKNRPPPQMSLRMVLWVAASLAGRPPLPGPPGRLSVWSCQVLQLLRFLELCVKIFRRDRSASETHESGVCRTHGEGEGGRALGVPTQI